jgi:hypothetical protein
MRFRVVQAVFDWASLDNSPSLGTIRRCLQALPDGALLRGRHTARGRGFDDYPVTARWGVAVFTPSLRRRPKGAAGDLETTPRRTGDRGAMGRTYTPGDLLERCPATVAGRAPRYNLRRPGGSE